MQTLIFEVLVFKNDRSWDSFFLVGSFLMIMIVFPILSEAEYFTEKF